MRQHRGLVDALMLRRPDDAADAHRREAPHRGVSQQRTHAIRPRERWCVVAAVSVVAILLLLVVAVSALVAFIAFGVAVIIDNRVDIDIFGIVGSRSGGSSGSGLILAVPTERFGQRRRAVGLEHGDDLPLDVEEGYDVAAACHVRHDEGVHAPLHLPEVPQSRHVQRRRRWEWRGRMVAVLLLLDVLLLLLLLLLVRQP